MVVSTAFGQYLRARRELLRPEDVGLPSLGRRRVPGLRRDELALLAGISSDYYLRLEQGRDHHPSTQVVDALASALRLDEDATAQLHALSQPAAARRRPSGRERAPASIEQLIASWPNTSAFVLGRHMDVLAANRLASALSPSFSPGVNLVRAAFLGSELRTLFRDWENVARSIVAGLRALVGPDVDDPRLPSSWASCRCAATSSGACGHATTSTPRPSRSAPSTIQPWGRSSCGRRSW
jgi:transcriptional regulator with XRE-family HTH domain